METFIGRILHWNKARRFGFIEVKRAGGWLEKYFMLESRIIRKEVEPEDGLTVMFTSTQPSHMPGGYPVAVDVQVLANGSAALGQPEKVEPKAAL